MKDFRYSLIRFVPDRIRMEPINVGIILQDDFRVDVKLSPNTAKRKDVSTLVFQQWRKFFLEEIRGDSTPLFQPKKTSPQFLKYLEHLCDGPIFLSQPLDYSTSYPITFTEVLELLYKKLVAPPEVTSDILASRPTGRFRQLMEDRNFLKRGMKKNSRVHVPDKPGWTAYRQVRNGKLLAIDKVEVNVQLSSTITEIERIPYILETLPAFLEGVDGVPTRYVLLADKLQDRVPEQTDDDFVAVQEEMERMVEKVKRMGGEVIRNVPETETFADQIDRMLEPLAIVED